MTVVHGYASRDHYLAHLLPVYEALPADLRGELIGPRGGDPWRTRKERLVGVDDLVLVASWVDSQRWTRRKVIYLEHGAGQTYDGDPEAAGHGSYSGGAGHDHTVLFLCPSETVAGRWRARYDAASAVVGCPRLDGLIGRRAQNRADDVVAITFHWDNPLCPESRSAYAHWRTALPDVVAELQAEGLRVVGHGHPRWGRTMRQAWAAMGVAYAEDLDAVLAEATVLVADNTSAAYEAAALDIPVVSLNAPWYRRDVEHGLRFWSHVPGFEVDGPEQDLAGHVVMEATSGGAESAEHRARAAAYAYSAVEGRAARRAVEAIEEVARGQ